MKEHVELSPDGSRMAFAWYGHGDNEDIFVQPLRSQVPVRLTSDPARDFSPTWSPDGQSIAFVRSWPGRAAIFRVPVSGGIERKLGDLRVNPAPFCRAISWSPNGDHLAVAEWRPQAEGGPALSLISAEDGTTVRRLFSSKGEFLCAPAFSPDGTMLAVIEGPDFRVSDVHIVPVAGGNARRITFDRRMIQGLSWTFDSANVVYSLRRSGPFGLWQVPVGGGQPRTLLETGNDIVDPHLSKQDSRLVFVRDLWDTNLWRVEGPEWSGPRAGPVKLLASTREESAVDVSPDSRKLVFLSARTGAFELWTAGIEGSIFRRLTHFNGPETGYPRWSPDGKRIAFTSYPSGQPSIFVVASEGGDPRRLTNGEMPFWSEDGEWIYFLSGLTGTRALWKISAEDGDPVRVINIDTAMAVPSKDAKYLFYEQDDRLWKKARSGAPAESMVENVAHGMWTPTLGGICYLNYEAAPFAVECLSLPSLIRKRIASLGSWPRVYGPPGFAVSPDGKWIFYHRVDQLDSNIMLAK